MALTKSNLNFLTSQSVAAGATLNMVIDNTGNYDTSIAGTITTGVNIPTQPVIITLQAGISNTGPWRAIRPQVSLSCGSGNTGYDFSFEKIDGAWNYLRLVIANGPGYAVTVIADQHFMTGV